MEILSENALKFWRENKDDLTIAPSKNVIIWIAESVNRLQILVEITEETKSEELRDAIPIIKDWQERLLDYQGPWLQDSDSALLEKLSIIQESGGSWPDVTAIYNRETGEDKTRLQVISKIRNWRKNAKHKAYQALYFKRLQGE